MTELSCPEARSMVSDYIGGDLPPDLARFLEEHLETCPCCPPLYASLVETLTGLRAVDDVAGVERLVQRVVHAIEAEGPGRSHLGRV